MRFTILATVLFLVACGSTAVQQERRTLPAPLVAADLPDAPAEVDRPHRWTRPVEQCTEADGEITSSGILFSDQMALRAARLSVSYAELRQLYQIDLRTWGREREVYERHLEAADDEIVRWRARAERSFWEQNVGTIALVAGIIIGAGATIGIAAAIEEVSP